MPNVTLFYDGACPLCSREARHYRKLLNEQQLALVDIAAASFDAKAHGFDAKRVQQTLHARLADGRIVTGVDSFAAIWDLIPRYRWLSWLSRAPISRQCMQVGYAAFARVRPHLPGRSCEGACSPSQH